MLEYWYHTVDYDVWCFYYVSTVWTENDTSARKTKERYQNQGREAEPRNKEQNRNQEPRNETGAKSGGMVPRPRTKEQYQNQEPRNGTGTKNQGTVPEPRTALGAPGTCIYIYEIGFGSLV